MPATDGPLIVEGDGGLLVPINESDTVLDLMKQLRLPVILKPKRLPFITGTLVAPAGYDVNFVVGKISVVSNLFDPT